MSFYCLSFFLSFPLFVFFLCCCSECLKNFFFFFFFFFKNRKTKGLPSGLKRQKSTVSSSSSSSGKRRTSLPLHKLQRSQTTRKSKSSKRKRRTSAPVNELQSQTMKKSKSQRFLAGFRRSSAPVNKLKKQQQTQQKLVRAKSQSRLDNYVAKQSRRTSLPLSIRPKPKLKQSKSQKLLTGLGLRRRSAPVAFRSPAPKLRKLSKKEKSLKDFDQWASQGAILGKNIFYLLYIFITSIYNYIY